ncbi:MAG: hypothetical protein Q4E91_05740 [Lachnospiraceae bacterium]|nr:hypothetical protein [Lachnospiraceae bacterium]
MRTGRFGRIAAVVVCTLMLGGCDMLDEVLEEKAWEPGETALQVLEDGTVTETVIDQLDESYYSSSELESMVNSSVGQYNKEHGADAVTVDSLIIENNQVTLTMTYRTAQDYADYNNVRFYNGSMLGAEMDGYLFYNQFKQVEKGTVTGEGLSNEEPLKHKELQVLVTDTSHAVKVPGDVVFLSTNAAPMGRKEVKPVPAEASSEEEGLVLPSNAVYVEEDHSPVTAKDLEKTYLYIIYEF